MVAASCAPAPPDTLRFTRAPLGTEGRALLAGSRQGLAPLGHRLVSGSLPRVSDHRAREQKQNSHLLQSATPLATQSHAQLSKALPRTVVYTQAGNSHLVQHLSVPRVKLPPPLSRLEVGKWEGIAGEEAVSTSGNNMLGVWGGVHLTLLLTLLWRTNV